MKKKKAAKVAVKRKTKARKPPIQSALLFCDSISVDQQSSKSTLHGVFDRCGTQLGEIRESSRRFSTVVSSLGVDGFSLRKPIPITVCPDGDEYIANYFDANISAAGCTEQEAIANLQSLVVDFFVELERHKDSELGRSMKRQKTVLAEVVCRTS